MRARDALMGHHMRAQDLPQAAVRAFAQQVFIHLAQHGTKAERIVKTPFRAVAFGAQLVGGGDRGQRTDEQPLGPRNALAGGLSPIHHDPEPFRPGNEGGHRGSLAIGMRAKDGKGIAMAALDDGAQGGVVDLACGHGLPPPKGLVRPAPRGGTGHGQPRTGRKRSGHSAGVTPQISSM